MFALADMAAVFDLWHGCSITQTFLVPDPVAEVLYSQSAMGKGIVQPKR